jgi:hypothetical protein
MKTCLKFLFVGLIGLFVSTAALAHGSGYGGAYGGNGLSGDIPAQPGLQSGMTLEQTVQPMFS